MQRFFDSNVIVYSAGSDDRKADLSDTLIRQGGWISVQVLNEVANVSQRKMRHSWLRTHELLGSITHLLEVVDMSRALHVRGLVLAERYRLSVWDSMIVAAALIAECDTLYSEDMHHGLMIDGRLRIVNPFDAEAAR